MGYRSSGRLLGFLQDGAFRAAVCEQLLELLNVLHVVLSQVNLLLRQRAVPLSQAVQALTGNQAGAVHAIKYAEDVLVDEAVGERASLLEGTSWQPRHILKRKLSQEEVDDLDGARDVHRGDIILILVRVDKLVEDL